MPVLRLSICFLLFLVFSVHAFASTSQGIVTYQFDLPKQSVNSALVELAVEQNLDIVFLADMTKSLESNEVIGHYTLAEALNALLKGTKLSASIINSRVIEIKRTVLTPMPFNHKRFYTPIKPSNTSPPAAVESQVNKAQEDTQNAVEVIEIVGKIRSPYNLGTTVSSTKTQKDFLATPQIINALPEQLSKDTNSLTYSDAIAFISSTSYLERSSGITDEVRLRGFAYPSLKINGVGAHAYIAPLDLAFVDRIEVAKGPSSVLFGRMEPGGIVNMMLKQADGADSELSLIGNTDSLRRIELDAQFALSQATGLRVIAFEQNEGTEASINLNDANGLMLALDHELPSGGAISVNYRLEQQDILQQFGRPVEGFNNRVYFYREEDGSIEVVAPREEDARSGVNTDRHSLYLGLNDWLIGDWSSNVHLQYDKYQANSMVSYPTIRNFIIDINDREVSSEQLTNAVLQDEALLEALLERLQTISVDDDNIEYNEEIFNYDTQFFSGEFSLYSNKVFPQFEWEQLYGVNYNDSQPQSLIWQNHDTRSNFVPAGPSEVLANFDPEHTEVTDKSLSAFAQWVFDWQSFTLITGARVDRLSLRLQGEQLNLRNTFTESTFRLAGILPLTHTLSVFANYSNSFSPQLRLLEEEDGDNARVVIPTPADSIQYELGVKSSWFDQQLQASCAYFDIEKRNIAALITQQKSRGFECDVAGTLAADWHIIASYSKLDAEVTDSEDEEFIGLKPRMTPKQSASLWLNRDLALFLDLPSRLGLGFKYVGERFINIDNELPLPAYSITDVNFAIEYQRLELSLHIKNVFDKTYTLGVFNALPHWTNPGPGRTFEARLDYRF